MSYLEKLAKLRVSNISNDMLEESEQTISLCDGGDKVKELAEGLEQDGMPLPRHVALILDGNRRWAQKKGLTNNQGYEAGLRALKDFVVACSVYNIPVISLFLFSCENLFRPKEEVEHLFKLLDVALTDELELFTSVGARMMVIGERSSLPMSIQEKIKKAEETTRNNTQHQVLLAINYSGQNDIVQACKNIGMKIKDGVIKPEEITKTLIEQLLQTNICTIPSPDLLIRTSGELRISNYYLWQSAYTELYFSVKLWPDFTKDDFVKALRAYQKRGRRFGKV